MLSKIEQAEITKRLQEGYRRGNQIAGYWHCKRCMTENLSPNIAVGFTHLGIQIWCENHNSNIKHLDFCGNKVKQVSCSDS